MLIAQGRLALTGILVLAAWTRFVSALVGHLKGRVRDYAVENEVNNERTVWTAETYGPFRAATYQAVKAADPNARVLDSGLTMQAYLAARADELVAAGQVDEALAMLQRFEAAMIRRATGPNFPKTPAALARWLDTPKNRRQVAFVRELYRYPDTYDAVQLHFLQDAWPVLPEYVGWIRAWLAQAGAPAKPFEFWEIGFGWEGLQFSEQSHAQGVVATLVIALGEGAGRGVYEPYREPDYPVGGPPDAEKGESKYGRGLVTPAGLRQAASAYQTMVRQLSGYRAAERLDLGSGVWAYRFSTPQGDVYVVWAQSNVTVRLPVTATQATAVDLDGRVRPVDPAAVAVGPSPIYVTVP